MNKSIIVSLLCFFGCIQMNAQVSFKPGIRAGLNFSHFNKEDNFFYGDFYNENNDDPNYVDRRRNYTSKTDFYFSLYGALKLTKHYTLQPEIGYSRQGAIEETRDLFSRRYKLDVSYLSLGLINKFAIKDFNIHVGPSVDFVVENNFDTDSNVDVAFTLGVGYNFTKNFGIEARVKKGVIPVLDFSERNHTNVVYQAGLTYTFDVK